MSALEKSVYKYMGFLIICVYACKASDGMLNYRIRSCLGMVLAAEIGLHTAWASMVSVDPTRLSARLGKFLLIESNRHLSTSHKESSS